MLKMILKVFLKVNIKENMGTGDFKMDTVTQEDVM